MRFMIMHKTDARWEAGEVPRPELIKMIGEMTQARRTARGRRSPGQLSRGASPIRRGHAQRYDGALLRIERVTRGGDRLGVTPKRSATSRSTFVR